MTQPKQRGRRKAPLSADWTSTPNARRNRKMTTLTLAPETLDKLDRIRGDRSRSKVVDELVAGADE